MELNITDDFIKSIFPKRDAHSHKGQNGVLGIIGGSIDYYGAPIFSALAALKSGCDLVYLAVPECNFEISRLYPDFIVKKYEGEYFSTKAVSAVLSFVNDCDALLIGPGIGDKKTTLEAIQNILEIFQKPVILDSHAIQVLKSNVSNLQEICITPHSGELSNLIDKGIPMENEKKCQLVSQIAKEKGITILLKGVHDIIADQKGQVMINTTGNCGMTVGGTGDILAGVVASFISQKVNVFYATILGTYLVGKAGDLLFNKLNVFFTASDLITVIPEILHGYGQVYLAGAKS